jgi:hypothetical protein
VLQRTINANKTSMKSPNDGDIKLSRFPTDHSLIKLGTTKYKSTGLFQKGYIYEDCCSNLACCKEGKDI